MALDARSRSSIYGKLVPILGDDDANTLMSEFPSLEADELVTKQFLRAELAELRSEFWAETGGIRSEFRAGLDDVRSEFRADNAAIRTEMAQFRTEMAQFRTEMADRFRQQTIWLGGGLAGATALLAALQTVILQSVA